MIGRTLFVQTGPNCRLLGRLPEIESQLSDLVEQPFDPGKFALRLLEIYNAPKAIVTKPRFMPGSQPARTQQVRGLFPEILSKLANRAFAFFAGNLI